jgi:hypothetical protein
MYAIPFENFDSFFLVHFVSMTTEAIYKLSKPEPKYNM